MYCTRCGHKNSDDARFCASCGNALHALDDTVAISIEPESLDDSPVSLDGLGQNQALLVVKGGPSAGSTLLIDSDLTRAGRSPESDLFLDDITVSRRHAEILREGARFVIKDVGSLNGTYVNRDRVDAGELSSGDEVQIGKFKIVFYTAPGVGS